MARADIGIHKKYRRSPEIIMSNIFTGQDMVARNICEVTKLTGISGTQAKRLIETGNASIRGWVLDELGSGTGEQRNDNG